jgi:DnaJ-domain-containing protein 1
VTKNPIQAYPLTWPDGWVRSNPGFRKLGRFSRGERTYSSQPGDSSYLQKRNLSVTDGVSRILQQLELMGIDRQDVVISTNVRTRLDGLPRSGEKEPIDPGAAVAATLEAMRSIERHGGAEILDRAFTGFVALPSPEQPWQVLGLAMTASRTEVEDAYRRLAMKHHPDRGGDAGEMARINSARAAMLERAAA